MFAAIAFGAGDYHTRTENRLPPPRLSRGDGLTFGLPRAESRGLPRAESRGLPERSRGACPERSRGAAEGDDPQCRPTPTPGDDRLLRIGRCGLGRPRAAWPADSICSRRHPAGALGRLDAGRGPAGGVRTALGRIRTRLAHRSRSLQRRGIRFATITHAAGISSTGDTELDALLPFDEPYDIPLATARAIAEARDTGRRIIAIGTTVVRALEHASDEEGRIRPGFGIATQKVTAATRLKIVDVLLTGVHEPGTSHYELVRAFVDDETLQRASAEMTALGYHTHEFGDSVLVSAAARAGLRRATLQGRRWCARSRP